MRNPALRPLPLLLVLVAQAGCTPSVAHPKTPVGSGRLALKENGDVVLDGKVVPLEEVTKCNPAAHDEALRANTSFRNGMIVTVVGLAGLLASQAAIGVSGLSRTPQPPWLLGLGIGGSIGFLGVGITGTVLAMDRDHKRNAINLYNQGLPPCGPPLSPPPPP